jgi:hypothetical protein
MARAEGLYLPCETGSKPSSRTIGETLIGFASKQISASTGIL